MPCDLWISLCTWSALYNTNVLLLLTQSAHTLYLLRQIWTKFPQKLLFCKQMNATNLCIPYHYRHKIVGSPRCFLPGWICCSGCNTWYQRSFGVVTGPIESYSCIDQSLQLGSCLLSDCTQRRGCQAAAGGLASNGQWYLVGSTDYYLLLDSVATLSDLLSVCCHCHQPEVS